MRSAFAVVTLAAVLLVAGCASPPPQETGEQNAPVKIKPERVAIEDYFADRPVFSLEKILPFVATAGDGIRLQGHVYVPNAGEPVGTILEFSPYWNTPDQASDQHSQDINGRLTMTGYHQYLLDAGYAVALVNIRGTGISSGCFQWGAPTDLTDSYLVIETLAAMPHSNGKIGMIGLSYPGWTQYMSLSAYPPSLKAVVPVSGVLDLHSLLTRNGAPLLAGSGVTSLWNAQYSLGEATYLPIESRGGEARHTECGPRYAEDAAEGAGLQASGDRNAYWNARDLRPRLAQSTTPVFFTNGMTDGEGHILQFENLWHLFPHNDKRMLIGQWPHAYPQDTPEEFWSMAVKWYDHYLRDAPALIEPGVVEYQDMEGDWHIADMWPPRHTIAELVLGDRSLGTEASASTQTFKSVYRDPNLRDCLPTPVQAVYVSEPLQEAVRLAGNFWVNLTVTSTARDGNLAAFLFATKGDGACPDTEAREVRRALTDLRHPTPGAPGADFPINTPTTVTLRSHPFASSLEAGERLVLVIAGESEELQPDPNEPVLTVTTGGAAAGDLHLPVVEGQFVLG